MYIYLHIQNTEVLVESSLLLMSDQCTRTCSRPFVINNFNPTINVIFQYRTLIVGLKLLITKGREQVPVISAMLYYILALFGNWIDFNFRSSLDIAVYIQCKPKDVQSLQSSYFLVFYHFGFEGC